MKALVILIFCFTLPLVIISPWIETNPMQSIKFAIAVASIQFAGLMAFRDKRSRLRNAACVLANEFQKNQKLVSNSLKWRRLSQSPKINFSPSIHPKILKPFR